jgi:hypothetical protein
VSARSAKIDKPTPQGSVSRQRLVKIYRDSHDLSLSVMANRCSFNGDSNVSRVGQGRNVSFFAVPSFLPRKRQIVVKLVAKTGT